MGSSGETVSMKKHIHPRIKKPEVEGLKKCASLMTTSIQRITFTGKYGNILKLLEVDIQVDAISALIQFYDSPMRCFTFRNFQMAPTLEEFARILGYSTENMKPYQRTRDLDLVQEIAMILKDKEDELKKKNLNRNGVEGFPLEYFEEKMRHLASVHDWASFMEVLALAIFGIVLFPRIDGYVDFAAIDVFLAFKKGKESPVSAILADTYCTLTHCHEKKGKKLSCCLSTLYVWLITHVFKNRKIPCPMEDFKACDVGIKNGDQWATTLADLDEKTVRWYPGWMDVHEVIYQCGNFPNVPLIGTRGCINYNPSLLLRQLGYPIMNPPLDQMIIPFVVYEMDQGNHGMLKRVRHAWDQVTRKGKVLGKKSIGATDSYCQWIEDRVREVKLPFHGTTPPEQEAHEPTPITSEEMEELKAALSKSNEEKEELQAKLEKALQENKSLHSNNILKGKFIERSNKRAKEEEKSKRDVQLCLRGANEQLGLRNKERDKAIDNAYMWKELWTKSLAAEKNMQKELEGLKRHLEKVVADYENRARNEKQYREETDKMLVKYQDALRKEQEDADELRNYIEYQEKIYDDLKNESMYWEGRFTRLVGRMENHELFIELRNEGMHWRDCFSKLAGLANQAIIDVPRRLEEADAAIHPLNTPVNVYKFIEYCKSLIEELREKAGCPIKKKKRRLIDEVLVRMNCTLFPSHQ